MNKSGPKYILLLSLIVGVSLSLTSFEGVSRKQSTPKKMEATANESFNKVIKGRIVICIISGSSGAKMEMD